MVKLRVACAGTGYFSRFQYSAWCRMPDVELVGVANRTISTADAVAQEYGIPKTFDDIGTMLEAVRPSVLDVITPPDTHLAAVREAARHGVSVICQKPFCKTRTEAEQAIQLANSAGIQIIVHENFRFQPWHQEARKIIEQGKLGHIYQITFKLRPGDGQGQHAYLERQPYFQKMPQFLIHETAIHLIDVFRYLLGEITHVYASLRKLNPVIVGEDAGIVMFDFATGARGVFDGNRLSDHKAINRRLTMGEMQIEGSAGVLTLNGDAELLWRAHGSNSVELVDYQWLDRDFGGDCVYRIQRHAVDHFLYGTPIMNTASAYLKNIIIEEAIYVSHNEGRCIPI